MHVPKLERLIQQRHRTHTHLSAEPTICITLSICNVGALSPAPAELLRRVHTTLCLSSEESESASRDIFRARVLNNGETFFIPADVPGAFC
jgi:hypothetical protein